MSGRLRGGWDGKRERRGAGPPRRRAAGRKARAQLSGVDLGYATRSTGVTAGSGTGYGVPPRDSACPDIPLLTTSSGWRAREPLLAFDAPDARSATGRVRRLAGVISSRRRRALLAFLSVVLVSCTSVATTSSTSTTSTTSVLSETTPGLAPETAAEIARLVEAIETLRGLSFEDAPDVTVVSDAELEERVRAMIDEDLGDVETDAALYVLLGLLPPGTDLAALYQDLYGEQVAGFYDGETGELVIPAGTADLTPLEEATLVHELTHALVDETHGMWDRYEALLDADRLDEASALLALIEGDATLTQVLFISGLPPAEQERALRESFAADTGTFDAAPRFLQGSLLFPYEAGLAFVETLYRGGGFAAVDAAYAAPPLSTEQILAPDRYPADTPVAVPPPEADLPGYEVTETSVWGELGFRLLFDEVLAGRPEAAAGWAGDSYTVWWNGSEVALALVVEMETEADAAELAAALSEHVAAGMPAVAGGEDSASVEAVGTRVVFLAASDPTAGDLLGETVG